MEGSPSLAETMVDDREILINQQRNEIAALRAQLAEAGLQPENSARPPRPSPVSRRPKQKLGPTDGEDTHAFYDLDTNRYTEHGLVVTRLLLETGWCVPPSC